MNRKEVIKLLRLIKSTVYLGNRKFFDALEFAINYLNQPKQQWIPCSERLPDPFVAVLVSDVDGDVGTAWFEDLFSAWWSEGYGRIEVLAWMPLPESYKEGTDDYKNM